MVEEGGLFRIFGAGRVDFSASVADSTHTTCTEQGIRALEACPFFANLLGMHGEKQRIEG